MSPRPLPFFKFMLGNWLPLLQIVLLWPIVKYSPDLSWAAINAIAWIYLFPPFALRFLYLVFGKPEGRFSFHEKTFWVWYFGAQLQALYLRFRFLEEILRVIPMVYSMWLRLWGSQIGHGVYWAPTSVVLDRGHLKIGDLAVIGYGACLAGHHLNSKDAHWELLVAAPQIGSRAILGGLCAISPGCVVGENETVPATLGLAPFYVWKNGRRQASN